MLDRTIYPNWKLGDMYYCMLPVGQGDASFVISPAGLVVMIDCGSNGVYSTCKFLAKLLHEHIGVIQAARNKEIAHLIITHPHTDHFADIFEYYGKNKQYGVATLSRRKDLVDKASEKAQQGEMDDGAAQRVGLLKQMSDQYCVSAEEKDYGFSISNHSVSSGWLDANHANDDQKYFNNSSKLTVIEHAGNKLLLTGDIETDGWEELLSKSSFVNTAKGSSFIAASHHGHNSGWNPKIVSELGKPYAWLVSTNSRDPHCSPAYSDKANSTGVKIENDVRRSFSTKDGRCSELMFCADGSFDISMPTIDCARNTNQQSQVKRKQKQAGFNFS
jgi:competence protein ComEC